MKFEECWGLLYEKRLKKHKRKDVLNSAILHKYRATIFSTSKRRVTFWEGKPSAVTSVSQEENHSFATQIFESDFFPILSAKSFFQLPN